MDNIGAFILIPLAGYAGLWLLGIALFLIYFKLFKVTFDLKHTVSMIKKLPAALSIITVPLCSFISFFLITSIFGGALGPSELLRVGIISLLVTVGLDLLVTVAGEKINILSFPVNLMYLFAWLVIVPSVLLAGR